MLLPDTPGSDYWWLGGGGGGDLVHRHGETGGCYFGRRRAGLVRTENIKLLQL